MAIPATGRFTMQSIGAKVTQAKADNPMKDITALLVLSSVGTNKSLVFNGKVDIAADGLNIASYNVASNMGGIARFSQADQAVKSLAKYVATNDGSYDVIVETGTLLVSKPASDLVKANATLKAKLQAEKVTVTANIAKIDAQLALMVGWESGNALQVAKKQEATTAKASLTDLGAVLDAQIAVL